MDSGTSVYKKLVLALSISICILVVSIIHITIAYKNNNPESFESKIALNYVSADTSIDNDVLHYYNGNNFIQLSLKDFSKKSLTPYTFLQSASSIKWLPNGAVFSFSKMPESKELNYIVSKEIARTQADEYSEKVIPIENMYWYANFTDGSIKLLTHTDNPFTLSVDTDTNTIFYTEPDIEGGYDNFGMINRNGEVTKNVLSYDERTPVRIIKNDSGKLYFVRAEINGSISLYVYDLITKKEDKVLDNIYNSESNHTIYEEVILIDGAIYTTSTNEDGTYINSFDISSNKRNLVFKTNVISSVIYIGNSTYEIVDRGKETAKSYFIDTSGKRISQTTVIDSRYIPGTIRYYNKEKILFSRPYIYIKSSTRNVDSVNEVAFEKKYHSQNSSLERDIFSVDGDINSYFLIVSKGSLAEEYSKVVEEITKSGLQIEDITIIPRLGNRATFDL